MDSERAGRSTGEEKHVAWLQRLYEEHRERIYRIGLRYTQNSEEAQDILQETFVRAYRSLDRFRGEAQESTWLTRIAINICLNLRRDRRHERRLQDTSFDIDRLAPASQARSPEEESVVEDLRGRVRKLVDEFPTRQRMVFVLKYYENLKIREISVMLNIREGTVKAFLNRSLKMLRQRMQVSSKESDR